MKSIIWLEPIGNVWSTECGKYRIYREGNDYTPQRLKSSTATISRSIVERVWESVGVDCPTLKHPSTNTIAKPTTLFLHRGYLATDTATIAQRSV